MPSESATAPAPKRTPAEVASSVLDFSDAEFAAAPDVDVHAREVRLLDTDFTGIAIRAQPRIRVDAQARMPIAIATRYGGERDWDLPLVDNCLLVATERDSRSVAVVPALVPPKVLSSRGGAHHDRGGAPRPPAEELEGAGAQVSWTEVRERIDIPWRSSRWTFVLVYFDWLSNAVEVELTGGGATAVTGPAVPPGPWPVPLATASGLPTFRPRARTPPVPSQGVDFELELDTGGTAIALVVDAAFTTRAGAHSIVAPLTLEDGGTESAVAAIVPLTVLLVGANAVHPWRLDLAAPIYGAALAAGDTVSGCFALDLLAGAPPPAPGAYACYVVIDGAIHGPKTFRMPA